MNVVLSALWSVLGHEAADRRGGDDYVYDSNGIMTDILHKSGSTVKQGFSYLYDDVYNIEQVTHEDGSYWTYGYDNRYRLTSSIRHNANNTIQASYAYDYDTGDNMTSKTEPWVDDFNDGSLSGDWNGSSATDWPVTSGEARNVVGGSNRLMWKTNTDASNELRFRYVNYDTGSAAKNLFASGRYNSAGDRVGLLLRPDCLLLQQYVASTNTWTTLDSDLTATSTQGQHYDIRMEMNGATAKVWRDGALVLESTAATVTTTDTVRLQASANAAFGVDNVMFLASGISRTTTMTHRANNEIDQVTDYNGTASYTFDAWGRTSTEAKNGVTRTYSWTSANLLAGIDSSDTNETDVGYFYTGDLKRIWRMENASLNNIYTWDAGFNVTSEAATGNPLKTFVPGLAEVIGNDLSTSADYRYLTTDHLGSTRGIWDGAIAQTGSWEFTPYGNPFNFAGPRDVTQLFTGHDLDLATGQYYAPFRFLNTALGRWGKNDPLGMINGTNMYNYVGGNAPNFSDRMGLFKTWWSYIKDKLGKLWAFPQTARGAFDGLRYGQGGYWSPQNNAFEYYNSTHPKLGGGAQAVTIGNTTHYAPGVDPSTPDISAYASLSLRIGAHEREHTFQCQAFGPFGPVIGGIDNKVNNPPILEGAADWNATFEPTPQPPSALEAIIDGVIDSLLGGPFLPQ